MLAGHLDTMPPGNLSSWQTDPYELTGTGASPGGGLAGLGVADMKAGVAAALRWRRPSWRHAPHWSGRRWRRRRCRAR
jgi:acetylornithine deacetylase/succinyl-diaminopimelate desuccinylase-like protein